MTNKFLSYLFMAIVGILVTTLYVRSVGISKSLKIYKKTANQIGLKDELKSCDIVPYKDEKMGQGVHVTWARTIKPDEDPDDISFNNKEISQKLALRAMLMVEPTPQFVSVQGGGQHILLKTTHKSIQMDEFFDLR